MQPNGIVGSFLFRGAQTLLDTGAEVLHYIVSTVHGKLAAFCSFPLMLV